MGLQAFGEEKGMGLQAFGENKINHDEKIN